MIIITIIFIMIIFIQKKQLNRSYVASISGVGFLMLCMTR